MFTFRFTFTSFNGHFCKQYYVLLKNIPADGLGPGGGVGSVPGEVGGVGGVRAAGVVVVVAGGVREVVVVVVAGGVREVVVVVVVVEVVSKQNVSIKQQILIK
jgi:hypothetical protein